MSESPQPVPQALDVVAVGMTTPVGLDAPSTAAAVRAGICRFREVEEAEELGGQVASFVGGEYLPTLSSALPTSRPPEAFRTRLLQLSTLALREATASCSQPPPLFLALPEVQLWAAESLGENLVHDLGLQAGVALDERNSRLFRLGGAGGLFALREALAVLASGRCAEALVGGLDSFYQRERLQALNAEGRLVGSSNDGFIPGEGAAFLLLRRRKGSQRTEPLAQLLGVGSGSEKGHRYSKEIYRGDGLAAAFGELFAAQPKTKVRCVYAGFNGESLPSKEWGVAYLRNAECFTEDFEIEHPADCTGDAGAALGPIMLALATVGLKQGYRKGPCLVWSSSDREPRAAALLNAPLS